MSPAPAVKPNGPKSETPARDSLFSKLREKAGIKPEAPVPPAPAPPVDNGPEAPVTAPETLDPEPTTETPAPPVTPPAAPKADKGKANPWKLVDEFKKRSATLETELAELKKQLVPEQDRKTFEERVTKTEARNKELEDEIRFVNYAKSREYHEQYHVPYEQAFNRAMSDLKEIQVVDVQTNQMRPAKPEDFIAVLNSPLGQARQIANQVFGDFADDIMAHRKEVRGLFDKQQAALKDAKENGAKRETERASQTKAEADRLGSEIKSVWDNEHKALLASPHGQHFMPREGDAEWNDALQKGFALVDQAFSEDPRRPGLSPQQRTEIIQRHAAIRNRAAGWGAVNVKNKKLEARVAELEAELKGYKETSPTPGGGVDGNAPSGPTSAREEVFKKLRAMAK